jgi:hypothetical protein
LLQEAKQHVDRADQDDAAADEEDLRSFLPLSI